MDMENEETKQAIRNIRKSSELKDEATSLFKKGEMNAAIEKFKEGLAIDEYNIHFNAIMHMNIALGMTKQKKNEEALAHLNKAV